MKRFSLQTFPIQHKKVLLRVDFNVPLKDGKIVDNRKIKETLVTIRYLLAKNCTLIIMTHLGRPAGKFAKHLRVNPLANELELLLGERVVKLDDCIGQEIKQKIVRARKTRIFFLENLRFYREEEEDDTAFAHSLAELGDVYVNDAFGLYRKHASVVAITRFLPALAGFLVEKEVCQLRKALFPKRPSIWLMGGAKLSKVELIEQALKKADYVLIGGALAFAFLKAQGIRVGHSKIDPQSIRSARKILKKRAARKIILPLDFTVTTTFRPRSKTSTVAHNAIREDQIALDLGPQTIQLFKRYLRKAHTIIWNGPLGYFEWAQFAVSTKEIGRFIGKLTAVTICGGGETAEAIRKFHLADRMTHVSTGGGAAIAFLSSQKLPPLAALEKNYQRFKKKS